MKTSPHSPPASALQRWEDSTRICQCFCTRCWLKCWERSRGKKALQKSKMKMHLIRHLDQELRVAYKLQPNFLSQDSGIPLPHWILQDWFPWWPSNTPQTLPSDPKHLSSLCSNAPCARRKRGSFLFPPYFSTSNIPYNWRKKKRVLVTQSYSILCDPKYCSPPGKNTGVGCHAFLQGIFLTQESYPCLLCLLHWQAGSLPHGPSVNPYSYPTCNF